MLFALIDRTGPMAQGNKPNENCLQGTAMPTTDQDKGIATIPSTGSVSASLDRLEVLAKSKGMAIFSRIDFGKDAAAVGMQLRPTQLLILGNPKGGTPLIQAVGSTALDLPLKVLAWEDDAGACQMSFSRPEYLQRRHGFPEALVANIAGLASLVEAAAKSG
jgi:uncharacterized protein (DUF302 family)